MDTLVELLQSAGKKPVTILKDTPGQLGNRLFHALIREAIRRSIGEPEPTVDPFRDWIGGSDAAPAPVDEVVYGQ